MSMNMINWERFYTDAKGYSEEDMMVDQIEIDIKNNRFVVISAADFAITDGEDDNGDEQYSSYISREMFDLLVEALKAKGLKQTTWQEVTNTEDFEDYDF